MCSEEIKRIKINLKLSESHGFQCIEKENLSKEKIEIKPYLQVWTKEQALCSLGHWGKRSEWIRKLLINKGNILIWLSCSIEDNNCHQFLPKCQDQVCYGYCAGNHDSMTCSDKDATWPSTSVFCIPKCTSKTTTSNSSDMYKHARLWSYGGKHRTVRLIFSNGHSRPPRRSDGDCKRLCFWFCSELVKNSSCSASDSTV